MKLSNLLCCTSSSAVAVAPQESTTKLKPSTTINASNNIYYQMPDLLLWSIFVGLMNVQYRYFMTTTAPILIEILTVYI